MPRKEALRQNATLCRDEYFSEKEPIDAPTVFHEPWWLDVTTQGRIEMVESIEHGKVVGRMYDLRQNRCGIISSNMPPFTHFLGAAIDPGTGSPLTRHLKALSITTDLITKLPRGSAFRQKMHHLVPDARHDAQCDPQPAGSCTSHRQGFGSVTAPRYIIERSTAAYKLLRVMRRSLSDSRNLFC